MPAEEVTRILADPVLSQEFHQGPRASTTYVGFTMTKPPFDDVLVRKAFSAAIDRETMVRDVVGSGVPATQFAPPGIFGAPDPEVGLGTDPVQAAAWLAEAGYPDGEGFPVVTYRYFANSLEEALAQALQAMWKETLNVDVQLEARSSQSSWPGQVQTFRLKRCQRCGGSDGAPTIRTRTTGSTKSSTARTARIVRVLRAPRPTRRQSRLRSRPILRCAEFYRDVEQLMFGEELRAAPYYHRGFTILTKPYLQRTYPTFAPENWDTWRIEQ